MTLFSWCTCDFICSLNISSLYSSGILQREQEQSVIYGSVDSGKNVSSHGKFLELVRELPNTYLVMCYSSVLVVIRHPLCIRITAKMFDVE